jgi:hypothetical protein
LAQWAACLLLGVWGCVAMGTWRGPIDANADHQSLLAAVNSRPMPPAGPMIAAAPTPPPRLVACTGLGLVGDRDQILKMTPAQRAELGVGEIREIYWADLPRGRPARAEAASEIPNRLQFVREGEPSNHASPRRFHLHRTDDRSVHHCDAVGDRRAQLPRSPHASGHRPSNSDLALLKMALDSYRIEHRAYPPTPPPRTPTVGICGC